MQSVRRRRKKKRKLRKINTTAESSIHSTHWRPCGHVRRICNSRVRAGKRRPNSTLAAVSPKLIYRQRWEEQHTLALTTMRSIRSEAIMSLFQHIMSDRIALFLVSTFLSIFVLSRFINLSRRAKALRDPPGPRGIPIFGNEFQIPNDKQWIKFHEWNEKYGQSISYLFIIYYY